MSESGTPTAILSAEEVDAYVAWEYSYAFIGIAKLAASHEALRAEVERLTAERDEARALADGLTAALAEREQIEAALRERLARYERMLTDAQAAALGVQQ